MVTTVDLRSRADFGVASGLRASRYPFQDAVDAYNRSDYAAAAAGFERLAEAGDARAQRDIALLYVEGQGVAQDYAKAMLWYRKSAEQGFAPSQVDLAIMYEEGEGVPVDLDQAIAWYAKAAAQNFLPVEQKLVGLSDGRTTPTR